MLDKNIVRINGYKDNKRNHIDIVVKNTQVKFASSGVEYSLTIPNVPHFSDIANIGFANGLDGVTSYNYYNWVDKQRTTEKVL